MLKDEILDLVRREREIAGSEQLRRSRALPENCFFLDDGAVLCYPRSTGDSRYPYSSDGFTLWAHSSGELSLNESTFYTILPSPEGKEPYAAFFGGIPNNGGYRPVSVTGAARQPQEKVDRFTVFTPAAVYYIAVAESLVFFVRAFVSDDKKAVFSVGVVNTGKKSAEPYLSAHLNCLCMHAAGESVETKWFKECRLTERGFMFESVENLDRTRRLFNCATIDRAVHGDVVYGEHTCSRSDYTGGMTAPLCCAEPLFTGRFRSRKEVCKFGDTAAAGDIYKVTVAAGGMAAIDYTIKTYHDRAQALSSSPAPADYADKAFERAKKAAGLLFDGKYALDINFNDIDGEISGRTFTEFVKNVVRQTNFAALAKNSGVELLGVRDVTQQLEAALMWTPERAREKFIEILSYIDPSGRPLRQYSIPVKGASPKVDSRAFIDQGVWIISAITTYLSYTDDFTILDELCGYYKLIEVNRVEPVDLMDTVWDHLIRIADYLISNLDGATGCLRALYGDWNDALDGLGISQDGSAEYGSGVSVMASLQLLQNLDELSAIADKRGDGAAAERYKTERSKLIAALNKNAVEHRGAERRILHGWGDKRSYTVGGYRDCDGQSRDGLTANAFWVISGAYADDRSIKQDILKALSRLDGKYGLLTFAPHFEPDVKGVGRIVDLPKGTAENGATYIHAAMFGIWALFLMGEGKEAWRQLKKVLPLTHSLITTTPFVMSNSYSYNEELGLDGESMSDWYTGSANALIKTLVRYVFGVVPDLDGLKISPCAYMPTLSCELSLCVKGKRVTVRYRKRGDGVRKIALDGKTVDTVPDPTSGAPTVYIAAADINDGMIVTVTD